MPVLPRAFTGIEYPIAQGQNVPSKITSVYYLYVAYTLNTAGTRVATAQYSTGSGQYSIATTIDAFITGILPPNALPNGIGALEVLASGDTPAILEPCYVIFAIDRQGAVEFRRDLDGAATDDYDAANPCYINLIHYCDDGTSFNGNNLKQIPPPGSNSPCHLILMCAAQSPSPFGKKGNSDAFNLHVNIKQVDGSMVSDTIDPDIKNIGRIGGTGGA